MVIVDAAIIACMTFQLTKTQRANILAGLADVQSRTVEKYLDGQTVHARKRERIELAERTWSQMVADHDDACERRKLDKLAPVDSDSMKGGNNGHE